MSSVPIGLTQGFIALVSEEDAERVLIYNWYAHTRNGRDYYARRVYGSPKRIYQALAAFVLDSPQGSIVDHIDGDTLNNQRYNLRIATIAQNAMNTRKRPGTSSQYKGVSYVKRDNVWRAYIMKDRKALCLGRFEREIDAAVAYDNAARKLFGEFARTNFPV